MGAFLDLLQVKTVITDGAGIATAPTFKAGNTASGPYIVTAAIGGFSQNFSQRSTSGFTATHFGTNGDKPTPNAYVY